MKAGTDPMRAPAQKAGGSAPDHRRIGTGSAEKIFSKTAKKCLTYHCACDIIYVFEGDKSPGTEGETAMIYKFSVRFIESPNEIYLESAPLADCIGFIEGEGLENICFITSDLTGEPVPVEKYGSY